MDAAQGFMVVEWVVVSLLLSMEPNGTGESTVESARQQSRLRFSAALGSTLAIGPPAFYVGPTLHLEVGALFDDRFSFGAMLDLSSRIGVSSLLAAGTFTWAATDWLALGAGLGLAHFGGTGWEEFPSAQALLAPLRVDFAIPARGPHEVRRNSFVISVMAAPGLSRLAGTGFSRVPSGTFGPAIVSGLSVGWALW